MSVVWICAGRLSKISSPGMVFLPPIAGYRKKHKRTWFRGKVWHLTVISHCKCNILLLWGSYPYLFEKPMVSDIIRAQAREVTNYFEDTWAVCASCSRSQPRQDQMFLLELWNCAENVSSCGSKTMDSVEACLRGFSIIFKIIDDIRGELTVTRVKFEQNIARERPLKKQKYKEILLHDHTVALRFWRKYGADNDLSLIHISEPTRPY